MKNTQRGFIPLIAIIILGLTAVAGGTVAVISLQEPDLAPEVVVENDDFNVKEIPEVKEDENVEEFIEELEDEKEEAITTVQPPEEPLEVIVQPEKIVIEIDPWTIKICDDVSDLSSSEDDIVEDLIELCDFVSKRDFDDEGELKSIEAKVENKWEIWEEVKRNNESAELERELSRIEDDLEDSDDSEPEPVQEYSDPESGTEQVIEDETESVDDPYSDYNFSYTYSYHHPDPEWIKRFNISQTSRDLRITKAIFEITNEDAEKYDSITDPSSPPRVWFCKQQCSSYTLERTSNNTFSYIGSKNSGIKISEGYLYVDLPIPAFPEGMITNISLPVSDWEIWDNTTDKQVKTW